MKADDAADGPQRVSRGVSRRAFWTRVAIASFVVVALFVLAFDWNWLRPSLEQYLSRKSSRSVHIDDLDISHLWTLEPTIRMRGVRIENAPWADRRPFITAGELTMTCRVVSLFRGRPIITHLVLVDADVDLERQADGLRNWRLTKPDDRGPGVIKVNALEAVRSRIRFVHRGIDLDLQTTPDPTARSVPDMMVNDVKGTYRGAAFSGALTTGREITFQNTGRSFPVSAHAMTGGTRLDLDGKATDVVAGTAIDVQMKLAGPTLAEAGPFIRTSLPTSLPYRVTAHMTKDGDAYAFRDGALKMGASDATGTLDFNLKKSPRLVRGAFKSASLRLEDIPRNQQSQKRADDLPTPRGKTDPQSVAGTASIAKPPRSNTLSNAVHDLDAELHWQVARLTSDKLPGAASLSFTAKVADDVATVMPLDLSIAGGTLSADLRVDAHEARPLAHAHVRMHGMRIEQLLPATTAQRVTGALRGALDLTARGDSMTSLLGSASGVVSATLAGGSMPRKLDAELGLSGTEYIRSWFGSDQLVSIKCATAAFDFHDGKGTSRRFVIETDNTEVQGNGTIDLPSETIDLKLTPQGSRSGFLELRKSIAVQGPIRKPAISLVAPVPAVAGHRCEADG